MNKGNKRKLTLDEIFSDANIIGGVLTIPKEVEEIVSGFNAMINWKNIKKIQFEKGSKLVRVEAYSLKENKKIQVIDFTNCKNLKYLWDNAFKNCGNLKLMLFSDNSNLSFIGNNCFSGTAITEINLQNSQVQIIGDYAFSNCEKLKMVNFKNSKKMHSIGKDVFFNDNLNLLDFSGCDNIKVFASSSISCQKAKFSNILQGISNSTFHSVFSNNCLIELYEYGKMIKNFYSAIDEIGEMRMLSTGIFKYAKKMGIHNIELINNFRTQNEVRVCLKYAEEINDLTSKFVEKGAEKREVYSLLAKLGYFGVNAKEDIVNNKDRNELERSGKASNLSTKSQIHSYKYTLAKDYLSHEVIKGKVYNFNFEHIDIKSKQQVEKIARALTLSELVYSFMKKTILPEKNCALLLKELNKSQNFYNVNLNFANFFVKNFEDIMQKKISPLQFLENGELDYQELDKKEMQLNKIYRYFDSVVRNTNKKVSTRQDAEKLTIQDFDESKKYH